jgi:ribosomal protein S6--L-glutamate ligase
VKLSPEERATAVNAAKIMGLNVAGVDILRATRGPVVMEVNSSPGLEGIEGATGMDIAIGQIKFLEKRLAEKANPLSRTKTKGNG